MLSRQAEKGGPPGALLIKQGKRQDSLEEAGKTPHVVVTTVPPSGSTRVLQGGTAGHLERLLVGQSKGQHNVTGGG